jgi:hypothetical protein
MEVLLYQFAGKETDVKPHASRKSAHYSELAMKPEFPLRIITDDGECEVIDSPEALAESLESIDSTDPAARVWVRDAEDRTVRLRVRWGVVEVLEV